MINPNFLTDKLAERMTTEIIKFYVAAEAGKILRQMMVDELKEALKEDDKKLAHDTLFNALFKAISPYEKKFEAMLKRIWDEEKRILVANLKKMKKAWLTKDKVDDIMYPTAIFEKKIARESKELFEKIMQEIGDREAVKLESQLKGKKYTKEDVPIDIAFDVTNPEVQGWLEGYTVKLGKSLEKANTKKLRAELIEGMNAGEGVYELQTRIYETYEDWGFKRAKRVARTEALRASNRAALETYRQSGVVKKKIWITYHDKRTCPHCELMDGRVIGLEQNFWNLGDSSIVEGQKLAFNYEAIATPPAHTLCRCAVSAFIEDIEVTAWRPARSLAEAEKWGKQYGIEGIVAEGKKLTLRDWNLIGKEMSKLPDDLLRKIKAGGGKMDLVINSGITVHPAFKHLKGQTPRGWTRGTWDDVPGSGGTRANPKTVIVANKTGVGHGSTNLTLHEYGHTVDAVYRKGWTNLSDSTKWKKVWKANGNKGLIDSPYQLQFAEEYWAESFGTYFNTPGHGDLPKNVITYFNNLFKAGG